MVAVVAVTCVVAAAIVTVVVPVAVSSCRPTTSASKRRYKRMKGGVSRCKSRTKGVEFYSREL